jgi:hypothetical protein
VSNVTLIAHLSPSSIHLPGRTPRRDPRLPVVLVSDLALVPEAAEATVVVEPAVVAVVAVDTLEVVAAMAEEVS